MVRLLYPLRLAGGVPHRKIARSQGMTIYSRKRATRRMCYALAVHHELLPMVALQMYSSTLHAWLRYSNSKLKTYKKHASVWSGSYAYAKGHA